MNLTIRNISSEVMEKIRTLSKLAKRSVNNEILLILEKGVQEKIESMTVHDRILTKETQINIWKKLANNWEDDRSTSEIIEDIYKNRTLGRSIEL